MVDDRQDPLTQRTNSYVLTAWIILFAVNFGGIVGAYFESVWIGIITAINAVCQFVIVTGWGANHRRKFATGEFSTEKKKRG